MREILEFPPNVPVEVSLAYPAGKIIDTSGGEQRAMFSLSNGKVMFLDLATAQTINGLRVKPGQPFYVRKEHSGKKGDKQTWSAWLSPSPTVGERLDGTFVVPSNGKGVAGSSQPLATVTAPTQVPQSLKGNGSTAGTPPEPPAIDIHTGWSQFLLAQTNALVDIYAAALHYASMKHGNAVKADDVRCFLTTAFINGAKHGVSS